MDIYNRGYNQGVELSGSSLGDVTFLGDSFTFLGFKEGSSEVRRYEEIGFYGIAYQVGNEVIISYRGTDAGLLSKDLS